MKNHVLWVVGNRPGSLGEAVVEQGRKEYMFVVGTDRDEVDVTRPDSLDSYTKLITRSTHGAPMDVVYGAGVNYLAPIGDMDMNHAEDTFAVNVLGFIRLLNALKRHREAANVVAVASDAARTAMRRSINYCASKAALVQAVRCAARELAPDFRINAVSPAIIGETNMSDDIDQKVMLQRGWTHEQMLEYERSMIPMARRASKSEVAELILSTLNGPEFQTGANVEITGGK